MQKVFAHIVSLTTLFGASFIVAHAVGQTYDNPIKYDGVDSIPKLLLALVDLVFSLGVPLIVLFIIYSGFLFVTAGDNESKIGTAKTVFTWTVVGALVLFAAKGIALAIQGTLASFGGPQG